jgi:hypothetical protein
MFDALLAAGVVKALNTPGVRDVVAGGPRTAEGCRPW